MNEAVARPTRDRWIEPLLALIVLAGLIHSIVFLVRQGYLPPPFFYEPSDVWMDWFNTAYWAYDPGRYDSWGSIYPPLSFLFLKLSTIRQCYVDADGLAARECDWLGIAAIHILFLINIWLIARTFLVLDRRTALPRAFALAASLPMLFALERGNLMIACFTCILLGFGPLLRSARLRWLAAGLAVNFKIYLVGAIFAQLVRGRWRWFEGAAIATLLVYVATFLLLQDGSPSQILFNITSLTEGFEVGGFLDGWYASSYTPLMSLLESRYVPVVGLIGSWSVETMAWLLPAMLRSTQIAILAAVAAAWLRPHVVPTYRVTNLAIALALITAESGGYTQMLVIFFVFMEPWRGAGRRVAIICAYLLCIPLDIPIDHLPSSTRDSFLAGGPVVVDITLNIGPFLRPLLMQMIAVALCCVTLRDVSRDIRRHGWRSANPKSLSPAPAGHAPV